MRAVEERQTAKGPRFYVRFREGKSAKAKPTSITFTSRKKAETFAHELDILGWAEAVKRVEAREARRGLPTLDEYAHDHIASLSNVTEGTRISYERIYERVWSPEFGHEILADITRPQISRAVLKLSESGRSDKTVANAHGVLAAIMNYAVLDGHIPASPCKGVKLPRKTSHESAEMVVLDYDQYDTLLAEIPEHYRPLVITLIGTGIRWGEAEALEGRDLVLGGKQPSLTVRRAIKWDVSKASRKPGPTKTRAGNRTIELAPEVVDALKIAMNGRQASERVFLAPKGGGIRHRTFWSDVWRPALFRAGQCPTHAEPGCKCGTAHPTRCQVHTAAPDPCGCDGTISRPMRIHDLRHTFASWLLASGVPIHVVQNLLGHESIKTTVDTYTHLMPEARRAAADAVGSIMGRRALGATSSGPGEADD